VPVLAEQEKVFEIMAAYSESSRTRAFGVYTGCICEAWEGLPPIKTSSDRINRLEDYLIREEQLKARCDRYQCKNNHVYSNNNPRVKLPLGEWKYLNCAFSVHSMHSKDVCRLSLKENGPVEYPEELQFLEKDL